MLRCSIKLASLITNPGQEAELNKAASSQLKTEFFSATRLTEMLDTKSPRLSKVNQLVFQGLEKEFAEGKMLGLPLLVRTARGAFSVLKKLKGS